MPVTVDFGEPIQVAGRFEGKPLGRARREADRRGDDRASRPLSGQEEAGVYNERAADVLSPEGVAGTANGIGLWRQGAPVARSGSDRLDRLAADDPADPDRHRHRGHVHRRRWRSTRTAASWSRPRPRRRRATPPDGFLAGIDKVLDLLGATGADIDAVSHGTTGGHQPARSRARSTGSGSSPNTGYEAMLEIARQSVPDGYGNSYFWVKPDRIVPRDLVKGVEGRLDVTGDEVRPFDEAAPARSRAGSRRRASTPSASASCTPTPTRVHEQRMRAILHRGAPGRGRLAVQRGAARVPRVRARDDHPRRRGGEAALSAYVRNISARPGGRTASPPFYVMKSNGGVLRAAEVVHQPITTVLSAARAAGALGAALIAKVAGFDRVLTSDGGGTSTDVSRRDRRRADADHRGLASARSRARSP